MPPQSATLNLGARTRPNFRPRIHIHFTSSIAGAPASTLCGGSFGCRMSTYTFSDLTFMTRDDLASRLKSKTPGVAIIDVRDSDYVGGHILGCQNVPVHTHDYRMPELVRNLRDEDVVVFHCALSQQRGPSSALRYLRERERLGAKGEIGSRKDGEDLDKAQKVYVLDGGFVKWQEKYGEDRDLTEGYAKDIWANGY
nr:cdc25-like phosphatase ych1 [Quercus suber]